jgi:uncharacterized damage-inducible protein DinB
MPSLQPEQANFMLHGLLLPSIKREHDTTRKVIEAIPLDKGDYRPDPYSKNALELAWHIATADNRFFEAVINGVFDFTPLPRPESIRNSADIGKWYGETSQKNFERLAQLTSDQLLKIIDFRGLLQSPAVTFLQIGLSHSIHHRGQLSTYLRPMGGKVPAIYGESYDSAEARKAAQAQAGAA